MYETMSISTGLYPNLDLWNANKLHYITLHYITHFNQHTVSYEKLGIPKRINQH